jgi:transcriptional regulator with XRE-family HTH domain
MTAAAKARGAQLLAYRTERGWSREQLAELAGLKPAAIYLIETGRRSGRPETWVAIAAALGVPPLSLLSVPLDAKLTGRRVLSAEQHAEIIARVRGGDTTREVGDHYGVSGERIRQIVGRVDPRAIPAGAAARAVRRREQEAAATQARLAALGPCRVCLGPMQRVGLGERTITCSERCADLWRRVRYHLDERQHETHRRIVARSVLARPDHYGPAKVASAQRYLAERPPPNRRFRIPNTKTAEALAQVEALRREHTTDPKVAAS